MVAAARRARAWFWDQDCGAPQPGTPAGIMRTRARPQSGGGGAQQYGAALGVSAPAPPGRWNAAPLPFMDL